jgi:hypothetical protein
MQQAQGAGLPGPRRRRVRVGKGDADPCDEELRRRLRPFGVRCNVVLPGVIETPMTHALFPPDLSREEAMRQEGFLSPMLRAGQPSEMADVIAFLDRASYVNGAEIVADGGARARCYAYPPLDIEGAT